MAEPSIAMIPSGYKAEKIYSVLPTNGNADLNFSRNSKSTRINEQGLIEEMAVNVPILDYSDGTCPSLLLQPQSTNLIQYSEDFSNNEWSKTSISVLSNVIASPSGEINASKIVESNTSGFHYINDFIPVLSGANTFTFYAKSAERTQVSAFFSQSGNVGALFDLTAETATPSGTGNTANIESVGNGWFRCIVSNNGSSQISNQVRIGTNNGALGGYQGDGTSGIFIWGTQVEQQTYATSYIKTEGSTQTRLQDTASKSGLENEINSEEGVLYFEISALSNDGTYRILAISDGTIDNRIYIQYTNTTNQLSSVTKVGGSTQGSMSTTLSNVTDSVKVAVKWSEDDFALWVNGVKVDSDTNGSVPSVNTFNTFQFDDGAGSNPFNGNCKDLRIYKNSLTDAQLTTLTTI